MRGYNLDNETKNIIKQLNDCIEAKYRPPEEETDICKLARMIVKTTPKGFVCRVCGYTTTKPIAIKRHLKRRHPHFIAVAYKIFVLKDKAEALNYIINCLSFFRKPIVNQLNKDWALFQLTLFMLFEMKDKYNPIALDDMLLQLAYVCDKLYEGHQPQVMKEMEIYEQIECIYNILTKTKKGA